MCVRAKGEGVGDAQSGVEGAMGDGKRQALRCRGEGRARKEEPLNRVED